LHPPPVADLSLPHTLALSPCNVRMIIPGVKGCEAPSRDLGTVMRKATRAEQVLIPAVVERDIFTYRGNKRWPRCLESLTKEYKLGAFYFTNFFPLPV